MYVFQFLLYILIVRGLESLKFITIQLPARTYSSLICLIKAIFILITIWGFQLQFINLIMRTSIGAVFIWLKSVMKFNWMEHQKVNLKISILHSMSPWWDDCNIILFISCDEVALQTKVQKYFLALAERLDFTPVPQSSRCGKINNVLFSMMRGSLIRCQAGQIMDGEEDRVSTL